MRTHLAIYDAFEFENNIKPDYSNTNGLEIFEDNEWTEYYDNEGDDINEIMNES